jgi:hypothetical protein
MHQEPAYFAWIVALIGFYGAFEGLLRGAVMATFPGPVWFPAERRTLYGAPARFVGLIYLVGGILAIFHWWMGVLACGLAALLAWFIAVGWPQR